MSDSFKDLPERSDRAGSVQRRSVLKGTAGILATGIFRRCIRRKKSCCATSARRQPGQGDCRKVQGRYRHRDPVRGGYDRRRDQAGCDGPNSFDLIDAEYFSLKKVVPTGNLKGIDTKRIKNASKITTLFTNGQVAGKAVGDQGTAPKKVIYLESEKSKTFAKSPTQFMSLIPTVYNADTLGIQA